MIGRTLSTYRIVEKLGAGGMGEVYRARDEKLDRDVAVKVLPPGLLGDETARSRFRKEAKALSRLSHPHVATLLDFGSVDGVDYLVMELVPGPTLDVALREGPLAPNDVVRLGTQLARGLAAAHEQGIVHRDLKPSNLCLTADGLLKILDFGLARIVPPASVEQTQATPTETAAGKVVGSPPYMSPEQLVGKEADARSDVYSSGACLYELATGRRPYGEKSGALLVDAILHETPEPAGRVRVGLPLGLESVIAKAMDKEPRLRYQTAKDLLVDLERLQQGDRSAGRPVTARRGRARPWAWATAAVAAIGALAWLVAPRPSRVTATRALVADIRLTNPFGFGDGSWATDGEHVYFVAPRAGGTDAILQVPIAGGDPVRVSVPFRYGVGIYEYVPAESALLVSGTTEPPSTRRWPPGLPLWLVPVPFGTPRRIPNLLAWGADLGPDGRTLAVVDVAWSGDEARWWLHLAGLDGTRQRTIGPLPRGAFRARWAPDGRRFRMTVHGVAESRIWEWPVEGGPPRPLWPGTGGAWTADGRHFVFERERGGKDQSDIFVRHESRWPPRLGSATERLTFGPLSFWQSGPSPDGRHLFAYGRIGRGELMRFDPATKAYTSMLGGESALYAEPSPDGQWLAWVRYPDGTLWKSRPDGSERLRLSNPPLEAHLPRWSPDGQRLAFSGRSPSQPQLSIHVVAADGSTMDVVARPPEGLDDYWDPCWMPDGTLVFGLARRGQTGGASPGRSAWEGCPPHARCGDTPLPEVLEAG